MKPQPKTYTARWSYEFFMDNTYPELADQIKRALESEKKSICLGHPTEGKSK